MAEPSDGELERERRRQRDLPRFELVETALHLHARIAARHREGVAGVGDGVGQILQLARVDHAVAAPLRFVVIEQVRDVDLEARLHLAEAVGVVGAGDR